MHKQTVTITSLSPAGHGIAENGWHILGSIPGDIVVAKRYKQAENISYAELLEIVTPSEHRLITPESSPYFDPNAPWQHIDPAYENTAKANIVGAIFKDRGIHPGTQNFIGNSGRRDHYRNKAAYAFTQDKDGKLAFALFTRGIERSGKIPQKENILVHEKINKIGKQFLHFFNQKQVPLLDLKYLTLRYSYSTDTVVAHILVKETNRKKLSWKKTDLENFLKQNPGLDGILVSHSESGTRSATTTKDFYAVGNIELTESILGKEQGESAPAERGCPGVYTYHPSQFFQIYPEAFSKLLSDCRNIISGIPDREKYDLIDFFAGIGIIGLEFADLVATVHGVEQSPLAKKYAHKNKRNNNIENFSFTEANVDEALDFIQPKQILVVDPARSGLTKKSTERISKVQPEYILYISCNPETQADDYYQLQEFYDIKWAQGYNLFPKTPHIEHVLFLKRKN